MNELSKLIELLSLVVEEDLDCGIAEDLSEKVAWDKLPDIVEVYRNLFHYWHDQDSREKDTEYKLMQEVELIKLIQHLKNKEFHRACNISFLCATPNS